MTMGQVEWLRLWFLNGFTPSSARPSLTFRSSTANHGHLLFTWSQAFESTMDLITLSKYCVGYLDKEVGLASLPQNLVGSATPHVCEPQHVEVSFGFFWFFNNYDSDCTSLGTGGRSPSI